MLISQLEFPCRGGWLLHPSIVEMDLVGEELDHPWAPPFLFPAAAAAGWRCRTPAGRSAGGGTDLLRDVQVRLGHQETQASSSQTDQVHRAVTSRKQKAGNRKWGETEQVSSYVMLSRDREDDGRSAAIDQSD